MSPAAPGPESSASLVAAIAAGDRDAFSRFYDLTAPIAFGLIRRVLRDPEAAADVLQEVFWQIWQEAGRYDPSRGSPEAWVVMRAKTRAIDRLRSMRRRDRTFVAPVDESVAWRRGGAEPGGGGGGPGAGPDRARPAPGGTAAGDRARVLRGAHPVRDRHPARRAAGDREDAHAA